jgi:phosphohistidine phosphatase
MPARPAHTVYLVRHAKAEPAAGSDAARRLTPEGRSRFERHARALVDRMALTVVHTSPFTRARETAEILAFVSGAPVRADDRLASGTCDARALLALVREAPAGAALVGHNPEIAEAVAALAGKDLEVKPGAVAALEVRGREITLAWLELPGK